MKLLICSPDLLPAHKLAGGSLPREAGSLLFRLVLLATVVVSIAGGVDLLHLLLGRPHEVGDGVGFCSSWLSG